MGITLKEWHVANANVLRFHARRILSTLPSRILWSWPAWIYVPVGVILAPYIVLTILAGYGPPQRNSPAFQALTISLIAFILHVPWCLVLHYVVGAEQRPLYKPSLADACTGARGPYVLYLRGFSPEGERSLQRTTKTTMPLAIKPQRFIPDGHVAPPCQVDELDFAPGIVEALLASLVPGRLIAFANWDDQRPSAGIGYVVCGSDWKNVVRDQIEQASAIVVNPTGGGPGIETEFSLIAQLGAQKKTVVVSDRFPNRSSRLSGADAVAPDASSLRTALAAIAPQLFEARGPRLPDSAQLATCEQFDRATAPDSARMETKILPQL